jgi:hypothetical protein
MKKILVVLAVAFTFTTAMPVAALMAGVQSTAPGPDLLTRPGEIAAQTILIAQ